MRMGAISPPRPIPTVTAAPTAPKAARAGVPSSSESTVRQKMSPSMASSMVRSGLARISGSAETSQWAITFAAMAALSGSSAWRSKRSVPSS